MKKIVSLLLAVIISFSCAAAVFSVGTEDLPETVSENDAVIAEEDTASPFTDVPVDHKNFEAIEGLTKLGVINGKGEGLFCPDDSITRAEFVKIFCVAAHLEKDPDFEPKDFSDTKDHWAKEYIDIACTNGLVSGTSDTEFSPDDKVTYQQISKICVNFINLEAVALEKGGWPNGYLVVMVDNSLFFGTDVFTENYQSEAYYAGNAKRSDVAQIVFNMITFGMLSKPDETIEGIPQNEIDFTIDDDTGEDLSKHQNPTAQQIFNIVFTELDGKEVLYDQPNVLFSIMAMIYAESDGKHYDGKNIYKNGTRYGLCGLDDGKYKSKGLSWKENLEIGVKEFAVIYWSLIRYEDGEIFYDDAVNKAMIAEKAALFDDACARTAYSIYRGGTENKESWFTEPTADDEKFSKVYSERLWAEHLNDSPEEVTETEEEEQPEETEDPETVHSDALDYTLFNKLLPSQKYVKQSMNDSCTLASMTMLFRLRAIYDCNENYKMITESSMIQQGNWPNGLTYVPQFHSASANLHLKGIVKIVECSPQETMKKLRSMLDAHPEGIVLYVYSPNNTWKHAVVLTRYDSNNFYCLDPANSTPYGEINLLSSAICDTRHAAQRTSLDSLFKNCVKVWYITSH